MQKYSAAISGHSRVQLGTRTTVQLARRPPLKLNRCAKAWGGGFTIP